ncbi:6415_t:CDS:2, partial [Dentiscutata heterogama]
HNINEEMSTQRDWGQFYQRLDYVIEFKGIWHDEIDLRTTELIFHKGCGAGIEQKSRCTTAAKRKPNKRLKRRIEKFINDSDHDDVIEMTDEYASSQGRSFLTRQEIIEKQNKESHHLNEENANI